MGQQLPYSERVVIEGRVIGTAPIDSVDVISEGSVVWLHHFAKTELTGDVSAHLSFWSESASYIRDTPRGYRIWEGVVDVSGATLNGFTTVEKLNRSADFVRMSDTDPNRIEFSIATRGIENSITLQLTDASPNTKVAVTLKRTIEDGRAPQLVRPNDTFRPPSLCISCTR